MFAYCKKMFYRSVRLVNIARVPRRGVYSSPGESIYNQNPLKAKTPVPKAVKFLLISAATMFGISLITTSWVYKQTLSVIEARNYLTDDDLEEFKNCDRNLFDRPEGINSKEFIDTAIKLQTKAEALRKVREPQLTEADRNSHLEAARKERDAIFNAFSGTPAEKLRAKNDFLSFYCTNKELEVLRELRSEGREWGSKAITEKTL